MTSTDYKFGHHKISGNPKADWSRASAYLDNLNVEKAEQLDPADVDDAALSAFRDHLIEARGVDELPEAERALAADLAAADGVDISYFPGGENYRVSMVSSTNPLGLPGDLWALVTEPEEGAFVAALMRVTVGGELEIKFPDGHDWMPLTDPTVISDYTIVGAMPEAIDLFNNYDRDNTLGVIGSYPLSDKGPFPSMAQLAVPMTKEIPEPRTEDDPYWTNSGQTYGEPRAISASATIISSIDDLDEAISAAVADPDLRWYVERRVAALGLEADLPWLTKD